MVAKHNTCAENFSLGFLGDSVHNYTSITVSLRDTIINTKYYINYLLLLISPNPFHNCVYNYKKTYTTIMVLFAQQVREKQASFSAWDQSLAARK